MLGNVEIGIRQTYLPPVEVEFVYYVHPIGELARERLAKYLVAIGMDLNQSSILLLDNGKSCPVWRVDSGFLQSLSEVRLKGDWVRLGFLSFRHPSGNPANIVEYSMVARCGFGHLTAGDKNDLGRMIGIHPMKRGMKRKKR